MHNVIVEDLEFAPFITATQIENRIRTIAMDINLRYGEHNPVFIGVLNGSFMFMADLMKFIDIRCEVSFVKLASYHGTTNGDIKELLGVGIDLTGRHVIIVEDIVDTGNSLLHTMQALHKHEVAGISVCTLLMKPECLKHDFELIDYVGFEIAPEFVVGYGLDYNGQGRNLRHIYKVVK